MPKTTMVGPSSAWEITQDDVQETTEEAPEETAEPAVEDKAQTPHKAIRVKKSA